MPSSRTSKVLLLSIGQALSTFAGIGFTMIASRWLSKHDYATIRQTFLAYEFAAPLLMLGLPNAVFYFLPRSEFEKKGVIIDNIALLLASGLIFSLFIALGGHNLLAMRFNNMELQKTLRWLIPYPLLIMPAAGLSAALVCAGRAGTLALYNVISSLTLVLCGIGAVLLTKSYTLPVVVRIFVPAIFLPIAFYLMFSSAPGQARLPHWKSAVTMLRYSVPLGLATTLGSITLQFHSVIVAALCPPDEFAVYINGAMEIPLVGIVTGSITTIVFAEMAQLCSKGENVAALRLFHTSAIKSACILMPTMCFLLATAGTFITFLYSDKYIHSVTPFVIYLFVLPVRVVTYGAALMALSMTRVILVRSVIDLTITCALCFILVKTMGYIGAAVSTVLTLYTWTVPFNLYKIAQGFRVSLRSTLPLKDLGWILGICVLCMPLALLGSKIDSVVPAARLFIAALLYCPAIAYLFYLGGFIVPPRNVERWIPRALRIRK
jgi:O-antigen/teichoic acid export membrane protein